MILVTPTQFQKMLDRDEIWVDKAGYWWPKWDKFLNPIRVENPPENQKPKTGEVDK